MLSTNLVLSTSLLYIALLFALAFYSERSDNKSFRRLLRSPVVYTLSISVYCTSWTFYGAVGSAARNGFDYAAIYLGPTLVFVGWWFLLRKLVRIGRIHRITSIADLISSRYGKNPTLAVLVTLIAVVGTTPYIALQLNAVTTSFGVVSRTATGIEQGDVMTAFWLATAMAAFTIIFGTRNLDANEHHPGVVTAIAFEALVKLVALLAVGLFVVFGIGGGVVEVFQLPPAEEILNAEGAFGSRWITLTLLSAIAIVCLPRQFQVTVVENSDEDHLRTASWLFPCYLFLISLFVLPIAIVGLASLPADANPDMFVLTLPMSRNHDALALFAFIGGFSSATSMVIVASIALSIMVSNHIVLPFVVALQRNARGPGGDIKSLTLISRRVSIAAILMLGFLYFWLSSRTDALASIGLIAFVGIAQFLPCLIAGLYWRNANAAGAITGLSAGFVIWSYTLLLPSFETGADLWSRFLHEGPFGIASLKPYALFGLEGLDPLVHSLFFSLSVNTLLLVTVSLFRKPAPIESLQSALFVDVFRATEADESRAIRRSAPVDDLLMLARRILGPEESAQMFDRFAKDRARGASATEPDAAFISQLERRLAGSIGGASARVLVSQVATGETISLQEVMQLVDETQQVIEYSHQLKQKSDELETTAAQLRRANEQLKAIDVQKDEFLSQVSHEIRTPMTSIRSFAEILRDSKEIDREQSLRFLDIIHDESIRLTRLLDRILEMSRLENGQSVSEMVPTDAALALDRAIATCRGLAEAAGVTIKSHIDSEPVQVLADSDRLTQVFINLITNAIRYNTSDQPVVQVSSHLTLDRYEVTVDDNGPGISRADRDRVFMKFARGPSLTRDGQLGTGLGLAISREIVRAIGGELSLAESAVDPHGAVVQGASFCVTLPRLTATK